MLNWKLVAAGGVALLAVAIVAVLAFGSSDSTTQSDLDYSQAVPVGDDLPAFLSEPCLNPGQRVTKVVDGAGGGGDNAGTQPIFETVNGQRQTKFITYCTLEDLPGFVQKEIFFARAGNP